jgi:hypothetical protein
MKLWTAPPPARECHGVWALLRLPRFTLNGGKARGSRTRWQLLTPRECPPIVEDRKQLLVSQNDATDPEPDIGRNLCQPFRGSHQLLSDLSQAHGL